MALIELPPPGFYGLPPKFTEWRKFQHDAISHIESSFKRFSLVAAPTGFGKSAVYLVAGMLNGGRVCILTSTKGLQSQLVSDFRSCGLVDIRGMNSYPCDAAVEFGLPSTTDCGQGPCHVGAPCELKLRGCKYYDQYQLAARSRIVVTNYSYWMHINNFGEGLGPFDLLILDEAHDAPEELASFVGVTIDTADLGDLLDDGRTPETHHAVSKWRSWATEKGAQAELRHLSLTARITNAFAKGQSIGSHHLTRANRLKYLRRKLDVIATMAGSWVIDRQSNRHVRFEPVWPGPYAERFLFRDVPRVVLVSATLRPKTASLLGIDRDQFDFREYPSAFPKANRPVIHVPTISVKHDTDPMEYRTWVSRIDNIIRYRSDRKGIVHTTSYTRRDVLVANSEFKSRMLWHSSANTAEVVAKFLKSEQPLILVSPSLTTGWDFPYTACEFQIIAKIPFPDFTTVMARARDESDPEWSKYMTMQTLVQMTGRGMRAADDKCETLIVDDNVEWFVRRNMKFAPNWWLEAYRREATIPQPPTKLEMK